MLDRFSFLAEKPIVVMLAVTIGFSLLFLICSVLADYLRRWLFKVCRIDNAAEFFGRLIDSALEKLTGIF